MADPHARPGLTRSQAFAVTTCQFVEAVHTTLPYTVAVYLVRDRLLPPSASEARVGAVTGVLVACWCAAQFATSILWGRASDRIGRKPLVLVSAVASGVSVLFFASASSLAAAAAARLIGGALNSTFVSLKCILGESCPPGGQARPMGLLALGWGAGCLAGPAAGGLSHPCASPALARWLPPSVCVPESGLFAARPFLLPALVAAGWSVVAFAVAVALLPETLPARRRSDGGRHLARILTASSPYVAGAVDTGVDGGRRGLLRTLSSALSFGAAPARPAAADVELTASVTVHEGAPLLGGDLGPVPAPSSFAAKQPPPPHADPRPTKPTPPWHHHAPARAALAGYGTVALLFNLMDELFPLYASAPRTVGGLALSPASLAIPLAASGVALIAWSQLGYHRLAARVGIRRAAKLGVGPGALVALLHPLPTLLPPAAAVPVMSGLLCLRSVFANNAFTSSMVLVNEAAPAGAIGAVNGAGQTLASLARAAGPAAAGALWAVAAVTPAVGQWIPFAVVAAGFVMGVGIFNRVPGEDEKEDMRSAGRVAAADDCEGGAQAASLVALPPER